MEPAAAAEPPTNNESPPQEPTDLPTPSTVRNLFPGAFEFPTETMHPPTAPPPGDATAASSHGSDATAAPAQAAAAAAAAAPAAKPAAAKIMKWTEALDLSLLVTVNSLGAFKEIGHGQKGPAFAKVAEQCVLGSTFSPVKHLITAKKCADRFDRLVKEHRVAMEQNKTKTGTDDEVVSERTQILDDIIEFVDDAKENYQSAAAKKKDLMDTLVAAGQQMRQNAMVRGPRGNKRVSLEGDADREGSQENAARGATVVDNSDDDTSVAAGEVEGNPVATTPNGNGGPVVVTPARGRKRRNPGAGEDDEMDLMLLADEREEKRLKNEQERLALDREGLQTQKEDLELRKEQQALTRMETEARIKLDKERAEEEKNARAEERAVRKQQAEENAKVLNALVNLLSREKK